MSRNKFIWLVKQYEVENSYITTKNFNTLFWRYDLTMRSKKLVLSSSESWCDDQLSHQKGQFLLGGSRKPCIFARKVIELWIETRAVISWVTPTTAFLNVTANRRNKTRKNWVPASSDEDLVMRSKRQNKVLKCWLWYMNYLLRGMLYLPILPPTSTTVFDATHMLQLRGYATLFTWLHNFTRMLYKHSY